MFNEDEKKKEIDNLIEIVNNSEISSIKNTVMQLINIIDDPNSSAKDLKKIIEIDPPLTAKLIRRANSAYYGYSKNIKEIRDAIVCLGFDEVKELALSQKIYDMFDNQNNINGYSRISLWQHSVAVALFCKFIYRKEFRGKGDNIYAIGLLHDIGIIILDQFLHSEFIKTLNMMEHNKANIIDAEMEVFGFTHSDIGAAILEKWGFSDEMVVAVRNHHNVMGEEENLMKVVYTIYIANHSCNSAKIGYCDTSYRNMSLFQKCLLRLDIKDIALKLIIEDVKEEINKMKNAGWF